MEDAVRLVPARKQRVANEYINSFAPLIENAIQPLEARGYATQEIGPMLTFVDWSYSVTPGGIHGKSVEYDAPYLICSLPDHVAIVTWLEYKQFGFVSFLKAPCTIALIARYHKEQKSRSCIVLDCLLHRNTLKRFYFDVTDFWRHEHYEIARMYSAIFSYAVNAKAPAVLRAFVSNEEADRILEMSRQ